MIAARTLRETRSTTQRNDLLRIAEMELQRNRGEQFIYEWKEDSRGVSAARIQRNRHVQVVQELKLASKELVVTRRAALRHLLEEENQQYLEELHRLSKTFHLQRL